MNQPQAPKSQPRRKPAPPKAPARPAAPLKGVAVGKTPPDPSKAVSGAQEPVSHPRLSLAVVVAWGIVVGQDEDQAKSRARAYAAGNEATIKKTEDELLQDTPDFLEALEAYSPRPYVTEAIKAYTS